MSTTSEVSVQGLEGPLAIRRDQFGVAHVEALSEHDAWFGQGFAAAEDRLWQMEYDRRRAVGRWSEAAGPAGLPADTMARKLGLENAARADLEVMSNETRGMFEAYAAGVNAWLNSGRELPPEYELTGLRPEQWESWHSIAVFRIRHILMGLWQTKVACARLLDLIGPERWATLTFFSPPGSSVILPPGDRVGDLFRVAEQDIRPPQSTSVS